MQNTNFLLEFLHLLAGIGIFLTGCDIMSSNLEAVCSDRLKELLAKVSNNKIIGVLIGKKFGTKLSGKAGILGGVILIFIGLEIFITSWF